MLKRYAVLSLLAGVSVLLTSCERIATPTAPQKAEFQGAIPMEYGSLVGVTAHPESGQWAALWFEKEDKTITTVWVNVVEGKIGTTSTIPRE